MLVLGEAYLKDICYPSMDQQATLVNKKGGLFIIFMLYVRFIDTETTKTLSVDQEGIQVLGTIYILTICNIYCTCIATSHYDLNLR